MEMCAPVLWLTFVCMCWKVSRWWHTFRILSGQHCCHSLWSSEIFYGVRAFRLEVNTEKTKYMFMPNHHTTVQNHYIQVANKSFENMAKLKHFGMTITNQNCIHKDYNSWLYLRDVYYRAVQNLLFSHLLSVNVKIKIYSYFTCCFVWVWNL
jgi:hypothetical protein